MRGDGARIIGAIEEEEEEKEEKRSRILDKRNPA